MPHPRPAGTTWLDPMHKEVVQRRPLIVDVERPRGSTLTGRRGTTVIDRSTAYPIFGLRAGRRALALVEAGRADLVHGLGASQHLSPIEGSGAACEGEAR